MEGLRALDPIAYVRFASVYKNFREASDFSTIIDELAGGETDVPKARKAPDSA
jgi:transcriptional repressor NrdR